MITISLVAISTSLLLTCQGSLYSTFQSSNWLLEGQQRLKLGDLRFRRDQIKPPRQSHPLGFLPQQLGLRRRGRRVMLARQPPQQSGGLTRAVIETVERQRLRPAAGDS